MKDQNKIYDWYLGIVIFYSLILIVLRLKAIIFNQQIIFDSLLINFMFLFNIVMLIIFIVNKIEKIAWILSGLYIFESGFSFLVGIILLGLIGAEQSGQSLIGPILTIIYLAIPLIIAIRLLIRNNSKKKSSPKRKVSKKKKRR